MRSFSILLCALHIGAVCALGGTIDAESYEYKGQVTTIIGHNEFTSHMKVTLVWPDWGARSGTYERENNEVFVIDEVITTHFWNVYPDVIHVTQPPDMEGKITIPFFMGTGTGFDEAISSLYVNSSIDSASMQDGYGNWHSAGITSFFDVFTELSLTGPNGEEYIWDLSKIGQNQGTWYLAEVTMTIDEFSSPDPATISLLGLGILFLRKRFSAYRSR